MKAAMTLIVSMVFGVMMGNVYAADAHNHVQTSATKPDKIQSLGSGKTCDKCKKNKEGAGKGGMSGMNGCCCANMKEKMGMMSSEPADAMQHDAMMERMQSMEARMSTMQKMLDQVNKTPSTSTH